MFLSTPVCKGLVFDTNNQKMPMIVVEKWNVNVFGIIHLIPKPMYCTIYLDSVHDVNPN